LAGAQEISGIRYRRDDKVLQLTPAIDFDEHIGNISHFIQFYFLRALIDGVDQIDLSDMNGLEQRIDVQWAFVTREAGQKFLELRRETFPEELCGLYTGKYLEEMVDQAQAAVEMLDSHQGSNEILDMFTSELHDIFEGNSKKFENSEIEVPPFDGQIEHVSTGSFDLDFDVNDYTMQNRIFEERKAALTALKDKISQEYPIGAQPSDAETYMLIGQLSEISERLIRIPMSITLVGVGAQKVASAHDIGTSE